MHNVEIYTDGSCRRTKIGGYGYIVIIDNKIEYRFVRRVNNTTNQRMELMALISAYKYCEKNNIIDATILSDSSYCLNCAFDKWYVRWEKNGFISSKGNKVLNQDLWEQLIPFFKTSQIKLQKVPGHKDCYYNNFIDSLVTTISNNKTQDLTGQIFNNLKVVTLWGNTFTEKMGTTFWLCKCKCGNSIIIQHSNLIHNNTKSCGCVKTEHYEDLRGQNFGYLQPLEKIGITSDNYALWKCKCCNCDSIINVSSRSLKNGQISCGCIKSKGEEKIAKLLKNLKYTFNREFTFPDLIDNKPLKFDFCIFDENNKIICLIEYQGFQHYHISNGWNTQKHLEKIQKHDEMKRNYCKNNNIKLIEISYEDYDEINENYLKLKIEGDA